jgi:competence protein ComEA
MTRLSLLVAAAAVAAPTLLRVAAWATPPGGGCAPEGRGVPPRHWVGCAGDPGPARDLDGLERLALGLKVDLNRAHARDLAAVPGLSARLAEAVVEHRAARGPFPSVDALVAVRGIGPARLARARLHLFAGDAPVE